MRRRQNSTDSTFSAQQESVIAAIVQGQTVSEATKKVGVDRSTYYTWLKNNTAFKAALNQAKLERSESLRFQLAGLAEGAVTVLRELLNGETVPHGVRLRAALAILQTTGSLSPIPVGMTDPEEIAREQARIKQQNEWGIIDLH